MANELKYDDPKCQRFNDSLDQDGKITIAHYSEFPSRILFDMDPIAYNDAFEGFLDDSYEELKSSVYNNYPSCIAYNFRLSEKGEGADDPVRRLLHLKDTWESIVFVLYAIVFGEIREKSIILKSCQIIQQIDSVGNPIYVSFNSKRLLTDAIKTKIQNLKAIIEHSKANNLFLKCELITSNLLDKLLDLQDIRNDISHHASPTKEQAEEELKTVIPIFQQMLEETVFLEDIKILRFESFTSKCKCEVFNGHALNKEYGDYDFGSKQLFVLGLGRESLFVDWDGEVFCLSPFLHFDKDNSGHESYLAFFKGRKINKYWFEPVKIRMEKSFDHLTLRFESETNILLSLIVP